MLVFLKKHFAWKQIKTLGIAKNMNEKKYNALYSKAWLYAETHFATETFEMVESCEVDTRIDFVFQGKTGTIFEVSLDT